MFSFKNALGGLFKRTESVLGIDIGSSSIKLVQLKKKNSRAVLETYGELALGPYAGLAVGQAVNLSTEKTVEALRDLFREASVTARVAAFSLPLRSSLLSVIELPAYKEEQINRMVPLEARKHIPVPITEVNLDWWVIPKHDLQSPSDEETGGSKPLTTTNKTEVLLVAIHKTAVKHWQDISAGMNLESRTFEIETFSAMRSVLARDISAMALLDVGASTTKLTIVDYGIVRVSHVINRGAQDITLAIATGGALPFADAEKVKRLPAQAGKDDVTLASSVSILEQIFYEANSVVEEYQKKHARLINKVVCTGGGVLTKGFVETAQRHFQSEVILGNPFAKVDTPAFMAPILANAGPEFAVALGLAIHELEEV
ncbi:MAG TPA: pilus assembly protein PilM [Candidatus Paceibacterota bacterium]